LKYVDFILQSSHVLGVEVLIRGGIQSKLDSEKEIIIELGLQTLNWVSSCEINEFANSCNQTEKDEYVNLAIKLHNKVRNLSSDSYKVTQTILKACSAWTLLAFSQMKPAGIGMMIKLFSRVSNDAQHIDKLQNHILSSCQQVTSLWGKLDLESLSESMAPLELQELKTAAFHSFLDCANYSKNIEETRKALLGALDLVQSLPLGLKLSFVNTSMKVGSALANASSFQDSIQIFKISLQIIGSILSLKITNHESMMFDRENIMKAKVKCLLSIIYSYTETKYVLLC
jgi:hypothetical protein